MSDNHTLEALVTTLCESSAAMPETVSVCRHPSNECGLCDDMAYRGPTCTGVNPAIARVEAAIEAATVACPGHWFQSKGHWWKNAQCFSGNLIRKPWQGPHRLCHGTGRVAIDTSGIRYVKEYTALVFRKVAAAEVGA